MMIPIISIIIPVYNVELYIIECLESVVNQTVADKLECIVVDDCSPDKSGQLAKSFIASYKGSVKFSFVQRDRNGGLSAARNSGVKMASGEYLYFLDSDDYLIPEAMEILLGLVYKYQEVDLLPALYLTDEGHNMDMFEKNDLPEFSDNQFFIKQCLLDYNVIPVTAANRLIRRKLFVDNNLWFREGIIHEDNYWTFFVAKYIKRMSFCSRKIYFYRETPGSITKAKNVAKETKAFTTMVREFTSNIDSFGSGLQKKYIFLHLLTLVDNKYYHDEVEKKELLRLFYKQCSLLEKVLVYLSFQIDGFFHGKFVNLAQRLFLMEK